MDIAYAIGMGILLTILITIKITLITGSVAVVAILVKTLQIIVLCFLIWYWFKKRYSGKCEMCHERFVTSFIKLDEVEHGFCGIICLYWWLVHQKYRYKFVNISIGGP